MRAGRLVHLRLEADDEDAAGAAAREMCEELIANPVIEDYRVRVSGADEPAAAGASGGGDGT